MPTRGERLRLAAGLLAAPGAESLAIVAELAAGRPWLEAAHGELAALPLDEWRAEHARLFVNGHPRTPCAPFESVHLNGMMAGAAMDELAAFYLGLGLQSAETPPDYLGAMLECAAYLRGQPDERHREAERLLWNQHLRRWVPPYAALLEQESRLLLYRGLARQLSALCEDVDA